MKFSVEWDRKKLIIRIKDYIYEFKCNTEDDVAFAIKVFLKDLI